MNATTIKRLLAFGCLATIITTVLVLALLQIVIIRNFGTIKTVGVEVDVNQINWGIVEPNSTTVNLIHVRSNGTADVTLSMNTSNWQPSNTQNYLTLTWNYTAGQVISTQWIPIQFSLFVSPTIQNITNFSFDITITGVTK